MQCRAQNFVIDGDTGGSIVQRSLVLVSMAILAGCGADVAGTATTAAAAKAEEARQAERMRQEVVQRYQQQMDAAQQLQQQKLQEAERGL